MVASHPLAVPLLGYPRFARGINRKRPDGYARESLGEKFVETLEEGLQPKTARDYHTSLAKLRAFVGEDVATADRELLGNFEQWLAAELRPKLARHHAANIARIAGISLAPPIGDSPAMKKQKAEAIEGSLSDLLFHRYVKSKPDLQDSSLRALAGAVRHFDRWLERQAMVSDLSDDTLTEFLASRRESVGPVTVNQDRAHIIGLWRYAWRKRLIDELPRDVPRYKVISKIPEAWTIEELSRLLAAARDMPGNVGVPRAVPKAVYFPAFILVQYDTALRLGDMLALTWEAIETGKFVIHKNQTEKPLHLSEDTIEALKPLRAFGLDRPFYIWTAKQPRISKYWNRLLEAAGLAQTPKSGTHKIRRTSASHLEAVAPGSARYHLGHKTPGLAEKSYIDPRIARPQNAASLLPRPNASQDGGQGGAK